MSTDSIGSAGGRDWANLTDWWAGIPSTLVENEIGEVYNDSMFDVTASINLFGKTVGSFTILLHPATGQGFADSKNNAGFKLDFNQSQGAAFNSNTSYVRPLIDTGPTGQAGLTIQGLQFRTEQGNNDGVILKDGVTMKDCIVDNNSNDPSRFPFGVQGTAVVINVLSLQRNLGKGISLNYGATAINCTTVKVGSASAQRGINHNVSSDIVKNCASFNFSPAYDASGWSGSSDYNCGDDSNAPGANSLQNKTFANQFVSTTDDFRLKAGSDCIGHGNTDATNAPNDIVGTVRGVGTAGDIGVWEFVDNPVGAQALFAHGRFEGGALSVSDERRFF